MGPTDDDIAERIIGTAHDRLGEARFGGARIDRSNERVPTIVVSAVDPTQEDVDALLEMQRPPWRIAIELVRYSRAELIGFYEHLHPPAGGTASSFGWDPRSNRVVVRLNALDEGTIGYFRKRIPADALAFRRRTRRCGRL